MPAMQPSEGWPHSRAVGEVMSQAPSMPVFPDALLADTMDLSTEEFGAYCLILFVTWRNNAKPLPDDPVRMARVVRVSEVRWTSRIRPALGRFFDLSDGTWRQSRLEKEWEYVTKISASQSAKGKASAKAKALKNNESGSTAVDKRLEPNVNPHTHTHTHTQGVELSSSTPRADADAAQPGSVPRSDAVPIIRAFDDALASTYGEEHRRGWPAQTDHLVAQRWLQASADLALCAAVFEAGFRSRKAAGSAPPRSLKYFENAIADALTERDRPMPEGNPHDRPSPRGPSGSRRESADEATQRGRAALARAVAERMEGVGTSSSDG